MGAFFVQHICLFEPLDVAITLCRLCLVFLNRSTGINKRIHYPELHIHVISYMTHS